MRSSRNSEVTACLRVPAQNRLQLQANRLSSQLSPGLSTGNPLPTKPIGRYRPVRRLGRGGMAEVYAATQRGAAGFERTVCLKRILPELSSDPEFRELFAREATVAGRLCHANLVQFHDCLEQDDSLCLIMELVEGMDLREVIVRLRRRGETIPHGVVAYIAGQLLNGLRYAHQCRVVHRDISPHNVLISQQGEVKLADFGVAKAMLTQVTRTGRLKGKLPYMSPEQASGRPVDHRTDLYSTGLVLYELLTGNRFFPKASQPDLLESVLNATQPLLADVQRDFARVVEKLLAPSPSDRFQSAGEALMALPAWEVIGPVGALELARLIDELSEPAAHLPRALLALEAELDAIAGVTDPIADARSRPLPDRPVVFSSRDTPTATRLDRHRLTLALAKTCENPAIEMPYEPDTVKDNVPDFRASSGWNHEIDASVKARPRQMQRAKIIGTVALLALIIGLLIGVSLRMLITSPHENGDSLDEGATTESELLGTRERPELGSLRRASWRSTELRGRGGYGDAQPRHPVEC